MIDEPALELSFAGGSVFSAHGLRAARVIEFAQRWSAFHGLELPACQISLIQTIPEHAGLGSGTQLGLAVAAGLSAFVGLPSQSPQELAISVNRAQRSAVGTYGFVLGGLIVEQGKLPGEPISPLDCRIDLPAEWRFVLVRLQGLAGLAGDDETAAFEELSQVPLEVTEQLIAIVRDQLVPAAAISEFGLFASSLYEYGRLSGMCFAKRQGGPYNGPAITRLIEQIRALGGEGVGQSSWGPTVYLVLPSPSAAEAFVARLQNQAGQPLEVAIARPCNHGAQITVSGPSIELDTPLLRTTRHDAD